MFVAMFQSGAERRKKNFWTSIEISITNKMRILNSNVNLLPIYSMGDVKDAQSFQQKQHVSEAQFQHQVSRHDHL